MVFPLGLGDGIPFHDLPDLLVATDSLCVGFIAQHEVVAQPIVNDSQARQSFDQDIAIRQEGNDQAFDHVFLSIDRALHPLTNNFDSLWCGATFIRRRIYTFPHAVSLFGNRTVHTHFLADLKNFLHNKGRTTGLAGGDNRAYQKLTKMVFELTHFQSDQ